MGIATIVLPALVWLGPASPPACQELLPSNTELQAVWDKLPGETRQEVSQWYQAEITAARTYQGQLIAYVLADVEHDPKDWPAAQEQAPLYQARVHAPAQVIPRTFVSRPSSRQKAWIKKVFRARAGHPAPPAWAYDYAQGKLNGFGVSTQQLQAGTISDGGHGSHMKSLNEQNNMNLFGI